MTKNFILLLLTIFVLSCTNSTDNKKEKSGDTALKTTLQPILDSVNTAWETMIKADDQKIADIKRLLLEISYTKQYDVMAHDSLLRLTEELSSKRYKLETMTSEQIDNYDIETGKVINAVRALAGRTPGIEQHDIVPKLLNDIITADGDPLIQQRRKYDEWAMEFNKFLDQNKEAIQNSPEFKDLKKLELFTIGS